MANILPFTILAFGTLLPLTLAHRVLIDLNAESLPSLIPHEPV